MAEAPDPMERMLKELEEDITCPVCQEHFRDPKILPCLHYYCKECVRQLVFRAGPNTPFLCPECRRETRLPESDPDQLPTAFFVKRMQELRAKIEKTQGKVEVICEMCSGAKAEAFCRQCTDFICNDCVTSHRRMKVFATHKVVTLQELKEGGAKEFPQNETSPPMCKDHDEQLKIYCFDCNCLICRDCIIYDHVGHKSDFVKKSTPHYKKTVKESLVPLAAIHSNISAATREVERVEREVSEQHIAVTDTIEQSLQQLHEILRKREKQLLDRVSELKQQKLNKLEAQKQSFTRATSEIQDLMKFAECSVESTTDEEFMLLQQHIQEQIQEQCEKHERLDLMPSEVANVGVRVACAEGISDLCEKDAEVTFLADPKKCTVEGLGTSLAEVGKLAQFIVCTVYQNGHICLETQIVWCEIKSVASGTVIHAEVTSKGRGVYKITYTPTVRGRHTLIVKVNGTHVVGSPFQVFAKIHPTQLGKPVRVMEGVSFPSGIALNSKQQLVVGEGGARRVGVFGKEVQSIAFGEFECPNGVAVDKDDIVFVSDTKTSSLFKFSKEWKLMKVVRNGTQLGHFKDLSFIKIINDKLYVCDHGNNRFQILNTNLEYVASFGCYGDGNGQFNGPNGIAQDRVGNLYVSDTNNNRVQVFDCEGNFLSAFSRMGADLKKLSLPYGICVGSDHLVYVCDSGNKCVSVFKTSGEFVTSFGQFSSPGDIVIDNDGFVCVGENVSAGKVYIL